VRHDVRACRDADGMIWPMFNNPLLRFLVFWGVNTLSLWVADDLFDGLAIASARALFVSGLMLGLVNAVLKPLLIVLTLPLSVLTLGFFVLIINALMLLLVAWLVPGLTVTGFWDGFFAALFVSIFSFVVNALLGLNKVRIQRIK
jgi:putative membrane protein